MKRNIVIHKNLIGLIAVAALMSVLIFGHTLMAAERVDTTATVKLTAEVNENDSSVFAKNFVGTLNVDIYKIATMNATGELQLTDKFINSGIDLRILGNNPTVDQIKTEIVKKAQDANQASDNTISLKRVKVENSNQIITEANTDSVPIEGGAGLYLYVPENTKDSRYTYEFTPYVIMAPTSEYITSKQGSDEWDYSPKFSLKSTAKERFGSIVISKKLDKYNSTYNKASFVYSVVAKLDNNVVFDNVYTIEFDKAETKTKQIDNIPAQAVVTVTEVYDGASYEAVGEKTVTGIIIDPDKAIPTASFENTYDGKMITGGISAVNEFVEDDGELFWIDESGQRVKQEVRVR
ncbi:hypothetical protein SAMN04487830_11539 [Pseudobutyrivibrio sp. OR37]|uniref:hypothetical protein n=1 Tax=Pseudobutyrivibrio sp. OR37 TaxID=1798186 RepID=UPI0008E06495|nr:hypothetical protein [Pseudobutyrivibrio sp. OR37]SFH97746.1 hypothetical protein SAMN04487830_11539 [Pseudobutyrivibrio sp. OR37]